MSISVSETIENGIIIDPEFKKMIPQLSEDEYNSLEQSILNEGCRDSLVLWNKLLIDGHNRYEICKKHNIKFKTLEKTFESRNDAAIWMINAQLGRRNLTNADRIELALKLEPLYKAKADENRQLNSFAKLVEKEKSGFMKSDNHLSINERIDTNKEIAKIAGVGADTVYKYKVIKDTAPEDLKQKVKTGEVSINQAYISIKRPDSAVSLYEENPLENANQIVQVIPHVAFNSGNNEWYTPEDYINAAVYVMGEIDLDPATSETANEIVKAKKYYTASDNGLCKDWVGKVWMNPPYAAKLISCFCEKLSSHFKAKDVTEAIVLVNNATETEWFNVLIEVASAVVFPKTRVRFWAPDKKLASPLQGQAVIYLGSQPQVFLDKFKEFGWGATI